MESLQFRGNVTEAARYWRSHQNPMAHPIVTGLSPIDIVACDGSTIWASDKTRAALKREIGPQPVERDDEAIAKADQEVDVHNAPKQPRDKS